MLSSWYISSIRSNIQVGNLCVPKLATLTTNKDEAAFSQR
jgi:hypothetical protein